MSAQVCIGLCVYARLLVGYLKCNSSWDYEWADKPMTTLIHQCYQTNSTLYIDIMVFWFIINKNERKSGDLKVGPNVVGKGQLSHLNGIRYDSITKIDPPDLNWRNVVIHQQW